MMEKALMYCAYQLRLFAINKQLYIFNMQQILIQRKIERLPSWTRIICISSQRKNVKYDR